MSDAPWNASALARRRWIMERLTNAATHGLPMPAIKELADESGACLSLISYDLLQLERIGYIRRPFGRSRAVRVLVPFVTGHVTVRSDAA